MILLEKKIKCAKLGISPIYLAAREVCPSMEDELKNQALSSQTYLCSIPALRAIWYFNKVTRRSGKGSLKIGAR